MSMKEAIEFVEYIITIAGERYNENSIKKKDEVIELLKRGEKCKSDFNILVKRWDKLYEENKINKRYRQMWEELEEVAKGYGSANQALIMKNIKQKYFPKPDIKEGD